MIKKNNHYIPWFHIKKWKAINAQVFNKKANTIGKIKERDKRFSKEYLYSTVDSDELENRIVKFESYIAKIISKIDKQNMIEVSVKELYFLKLYCYLCACRQDNTTEVIKDDESDYYSSNNYIIGLPKIEGKESIIAFTKAIMDEFERVQSDNVSAEDNIDIRMNLRQLHLCIFRNKGENIAISDVFAIIENTMDGDHLYTYIPMSPKTVFCLVKTKYYLNMKDLEKSRISLSILNGGWGDDVLSILFQKKEEMLLLSNYITPNIIKALNNSKPSKISIPIQEISDEIVEYFNAIMYEDSRYFIFKNQDQLKKSQRELQVRKVQVM